jgi:hypothetical protein
MVGKIFFADDTNRERRAAVALFDCDEDMADERISQHLARGDKSWPAMGPREAWTDLPVETQQAYLRRVRAVLAAAAYPEKHLSDSRQ